MKLMILTTLALLALAVPAAAGADEYDDYGNLFAFPASVWNAVDDDSSNDPTPEEIEAEWYGEPTGEGETDDPFGVPEPEGWPVWIPMPPLAYDSPSDEEYAWYWQCVQLENGGC